MKTIIGLGTALTLAFAPMAVDAKPKFKVRGNAAVAQLLNGAVAVNAKEVRKIEKKLRKAAKKAGVPVALGTVAVAASGGAASAVAAQPAPRFAPQQVTMRPRLRPEAIGYAGLTDDAVTPPVTTVQNGARIETSTLVAEPDVTPVARRVTSTAPTEVADTSVTTTGPKMIRIEGDQVSTETTFDDDQPVLAEAERLETTSEPQPVLLEANAGDDATIFGGPTGY